jgi:GTP-binding protein Era
MSEDDRERDAGTGAAATPPADKDPRPGKDEVRAIADEELPDEDDDLDDEDDEDSAEGDDVSDEDRDDLEDEDDLDEDEEDGGLPADGPTRAGFVALIGAPNAGKSTLLNKLVGAKVSIVSHKVQTTRAIMRGIAMVGPAQVIFVDTPGIFHPKRRLDRAMVDTAWGGAADADMVALLVDAKKGVTEDIGQILDKLRDLKRRKVLILNKVDTVKRESLLALAADLNARVGFDATFMVSALTGSGVKDLLRYFARELPEGPWLYPEDQISDLPIRMLAAEITREKVFLRLHDELPYASTVETEQWQERKDGGVRIEQTIFVERESQKKIVLGKGGQTIRAISMSSREELQELLERPVHLFLYVKVRENWADDPERYREMGLEFPRGG